MRAVALAWGSLLLLLGVTVAGAFLPLGVGNLALALVIAALKAVVILTVFMRLARAPGLTVAFAAAGFFWLFILMVLSGADFLTRPS
jgi:cytochrome c oxidase subunit IV